MFYHFWVLLDMAQDFNSTHLESSWITNNYNAYSVCLIKSKAVLRISCKRIGSPAKSNNGL